MRRGPLSCVDRQAWFKEIVLGLSRLARNGPLGFKPRFLFRSVVGQFELSIGGFVPHPTAISELFVGQRGHQTSSEIDHFSHGGAALVATSAVAFAFCAY